MSWEEVFTAFDDDKAEEDVEWRDFFRKETLREAIKRRNMTSHEEDSDLRIDIETGKVGK